MPLPPFPPIRYSSVGLERPPHFSQDDAWLDARLHARTTRIVPVWRDCSLILGDDSPVAVTIGGDHARGLLQIAGEIVFLGLDGDDAAYFAIDLSDHEMPVLSPTLGRAEFIDLRAVGAVIDAREGALLAYARGLAYWHRHNGYCANCGAPTRALEGGRIRRCSGDACGRDHFPRTDPAVIMLVTRPGPDGGACLLGRHAHWPEGMYSTLAGFVDIGESLEEAVAREVLEETAVAVAEVRYRGSQPWPFPSSLMLGFRARAVSVAIDIENDELEDARWFTRAQIADFERRGMRLPRADSIARALIEEWLGEDA